MSGDYLLRNARLPRSVLEAAPELPADADGLVLADVLLRNGRVAAIAGGIAPAGEVLDLDGGQLWPACIELHTHLDKGHTLPRARNPDGTVAGAVEAVRSDRLARWTAEDVERRFDFSLRCAHAHGTAAMRTHIDSYHPQESISWPVFRRLRAAWSGRIELQGVAMTMLDVYEGGGGGDLADRVAHADGILGGVTRLSGPPDRQSPDRIANAIERLLRLAAERPLDVDLHVDETSDLEPNTLKAVALAALRLDFRGRIVCGHCCSLSLRDESDARETIALVKDAGLCIVTLPMVNLHLQGRREAQTPRWRGVTLVRELAAAGVPVAASSDNSRDPFYSFGDFDPVEVLRETVRICHLDLDCAGSLPLITKSPADIMRLPARGRLAVGAGADLIAFRARSMSELLARTQHDRVVFRNGRPVAAVPPDYRELDPLFG